MVETQSPRQYDLEARTLLFAKEVIAFVGTLPKTLPNTEISRQLIRAAGSVGANYIEANESLGKKDFLMRIKISRKEAKESRYWLQLVQCADGSRATQQRLTQESTELMKIFGAILRNSTS
jgi:four helix bundle protein